MTGVLDDDGDTGTYRQYSKTLRDVMDRVKGEEEGWDVFFFGRSDAASVWKPPVGVGRCPVVPVVDMKAAGFVNGLSPRAFAFRVSGPARCSYHGDPTAVVVVCSGAPSESRRFSSRFPVQKVFNFASQHNPSRSSSSRIHHSYEQWGPYTDTSGLWAGALAEFVHCIRPKSRAESGRPPTVQMPASSLLVPLPARAKNRASQYVWNAKTKTVVKLNDSTAVPSTYTYTRDVVSDLHASLHAAFFPATDQVTPDYWEYIKWRGWHRLFSSMSSIFATQSLLLAVGVGAKNTLPAAAGINWWVLTVRDRLQR